MKTYIAYQYGKGSQSFMMKNEQNDPVYEANIVKFKLFGPSDYELVDVKKGTSSTHTVSKTVTVNQGFGNHGFSVTTASYFKLDGVNIFKVLESKGYTFRTILKLDIMHPEIVLVDMNDNAIATYKLNVLGERQEGVPGIGNKQRNIVATTESDDVELIFLGAFALSRVELSGNTL